MSETATTSRPVRTETWMLRAMALGFGVGATLFAVGTVMLWLGASVVTANVTYAVGALCFTTAAAVPTGAARSCSWSARWRST